MGTITLTAYRGYQDIGTVGQNVQQLAGNIQSINQILDVGLLNTRDFNHGWIRVEHLVGLGLATLINGNQLTSSGAGGGGSSTVSVLDSIVGDGTSGTPLKLSGDIASPGNDYFYGTNGSGVKGWYLLSSFSGTVTSVGLSDTSTTPIYTVGGTNPVTSSGVIDITLIAQPANDIFAGPTTGANAQPTFRAMVAADLPAAVQPGAIQNMESAGWNSSSGAVQLPLTVPQDILIPYNSTLREVYILTQGGTGSCTVTLWKANLSAHFPPVIGDDITGGTPPAISSNTTYANTTLSGWTTNFSQNDVIRCTLSANSIFTSVKIILRMY